MSQIVRQICKIPVFHALLCAYLRVLTVYGVLLLSPCLMAETSLLLLLLCSACIAAPRRSSPASLVPLDHDRLRRVDFASRGIRLTDGTAAEACTLDPSGRVMKASRDKRSETCSRCDCS
ncbi:hypothetical protein OBBRIDRAFT_640435 [Obba rivulosa]|uniref:Uncharacterized protein n=1 Tax=Obba rivulosa TaxID=1052685 RepID=A0A8E2AT12_9APHY|nr:hypothetical protein OBBRIDRAFT_640435 [Obba rivulosa]